MPSRLVLTLAAIGASLCGCGTLADYEIQVDELQKDVLRVRVNVAAPLKNAEYRRLAHQSFERVLNLQRQFDTPLYEVRFEFYVPAPDDGSAHKAATYTWRLAPTPARISLPLQTPPPVQALPPPRPHLAVR